MKQNLISLLFILICCSPFAAHAEKVTAKKIVELPRASGIDETIAPILKKDKNVDWQSVETTLTKNANFEDKVRKYKIVSGEEEESAGDLTRYRFFVIKASGKKEPLETDPLAEVMVLAQGKYLVFEPLILVDTTTWKKIDLTKDTNLHAYLSVIKYSPKRNKLLVAQFNCPYDCPKTDKTTIWEITWQP